MEKIPEMGDDAYKSGPLVKAWMNRIVKRANRNIEFAMPAGVQKPSAMMTDEKILLDFTRVNFAMMFASYEPFACKSGGASPASGQQTGVVLLVKKGTINDRNESSNLTVTGKENNAPDGYWKFTFTGASTKYLMAKVTLNTSGAVTAANLSLQATAQLTGAGNSSTGAPPVSAYRKIALITASGAPNFDLTVEQYTKGAQQARVDIPSWSCTTITKGVYWLP